MRKSLSLYIHIPFCVSKCNYCSFVSCVAKDEVKLRYVEALKKEIAKRGKELSGSYEIATVYIGGGTPSSLPMGAIKSIMQEVYKNFVVKNNAEITIELNPNTVTKEKVREYMFAGVNRASMGLQCATNSVLKSMGRLHTVDDFVKAVAVLRSQGLTNISSDIILGYPGETSETVKKSIELLVKLNIPHISTYMLSVEEGTPLFNAVKNKKVNVPDEDQVANMYEFCVKALRQAGFEMYEVSNFAKAGLRSKHNQVYWQRKDYLGLGLAAHSYVNGERFCNTSDLATYVSTIENNNAIPVAETKKLTLEEQKEEAVMLSLRQSDGLDTNAYVQEFGENFIATRKQKLASLIKGGFLVLDTKTNNIMATDKGFLVLNKLISELI